MAVTIITTIRRSKYLVVELCKLGVLASALNIIKGLIFFFVWIYLSRLNNTHIRQRAFTTVELVFKYKKVITD